MSAESLHDDGTDARAADLQEILSDSDSDELEEMLDTSYSPPERRPHEIFEHESLDVRLTEEVPEVWAASDDAEGDTEDEPYDDQVGWRRSGRLVAPDEGAHADRESEVFASDVGVDGGAASAEEAAMHIVGDDGY